LPFALTALCVTAAAIPVLKRVRRAH